MLQVFNTLNQINAKEIDKKNNKQISQILNNNIINNICQIYYMFLKKKPRFL